jgi:squalene-associated FAD-dependent desaturase
MQHAPQTRRLAIVGGGLAGLAAAEAAARAGFHVELFESCSRLGGRAGSLLDSPSGSWIDACQHLTLGCCTELADFCRRLEVSDCFERFRQIHFLAPDGARYDVSAAWWLPAPLHLLPGLLRLGYLSRGERWSIVRAMARLTRTRDSAKEPATIAPWLRCHGQTVAAIDRFWTPVLVSALGDTPERLSVTAARQVFVQGFLGSRQAYELYLPRIPLAELYDQRVAASLQRRGVTIHRATPVHAIAGDAQGATGLLLADGRQLAADRVLVAVNWRHVCRLFSGEMWAALPELQGVSNIPAAPITGVHLWFDRPITALPHAALIGRRSQWIFRRPQESDSSHVAPARHYYQVVISASHELLARPAADVVAEVCQDLRSVFPAAASAQLLQHRVITHPAAIFSLQPGVDALRPAQCSSIPRLFLAGDWTQTGWPATMEGAVRSGRQAVEQMLG